MAKISNAALRLYSRIIRNPDFPASKIDRECATWLRKGQTWLAFAKSFPEQFFRLLLALRPGSDDHCDALDACDEAHFFLPTHCVIDPPRQLLSGGIGGSWGDVYDALREAGEDLSRVGTVTSMIHYLYTIIRKAKRVDDRVAMCRAWEKMRVQLNYIDPPDKPAASEPARDDSAIEKAKQAVASGKKKAAAGSRRAKKVAEPEQPDAADPVTLPGEPLRPQTDDGFVAFDN